MDHIIYFEIKAMLTGPLHIGSKENGDGAVLIHPVSRLPFIQASSIAGLIRNAFDSLCSKKDTSYWFGDSNTEGYTRNESKIGISDGEFLGEILMERRPRVSIDPATGTISKSTIKGTSGSSGHKFETDCVGVGNSFGFSIVAKCCAEENQEIYGLLLKVLGLMNNGEIQFGGQRSNGFGFINVIEVKVRNFDLKDSTDRKDWLQENFKLREVNIPIVESGNIAYRIDVKGKTEGELLVKATVVPEFGSDAPDAANMRNSEKEYIIPGSSFKGSIRNQFTQISRKIGKEELVECSFGSMGENGNLIFLDTVVGDVAANDNQPISRHIHIDKFTGGVISQALFSEKCIGGDMNLSILIKKSKYQKETFAITMMALRDLSIGKYNLGSGYANGRGFIEVASINVSHDGRDYIFDMNGTLVEEAKALIDEAIQSLKN